MQHILVEIIGSKLFALTYYTFDNIKPYDIVDVNLRNTKKLGIVLQLLETKDYEFELYEAKKSQYYFTPLQIILLTFISQYYMKQIGIVADIFTPCKIVDMQDSTTIQNNQSEYNTKLHVNHGIYDLHQPLDSLSQHTISRHSITKEILHNNILQKKHDIFLHTLSHEQNQTLQFCQSKPLSLIFGTTGSGKTEIYFHAIYECLKQGKQALLLMPEISLTPQVKKRLDKAFPNLADIWHSKRTKAQKNAILQNLQNGTIQIIAGARSALFLPYQNLGLIIVDEEHDDSYKSNSQPKYHARDLAVYLSTKGIRVILGSATPSAKSFYLAQQHNYLTYLQTNFYATKQEIIYDETHEIGITQTILQEILKTLRQKKQIIIFVPTRANFKILVCKDCQEKLMCPYCSITLSLHSKKQAMICHYCNFTTPIPSLCQKCGSTDLSGMQIGTEETKKQLETTLLQFNYKASIAIFDRDNITTSKKLEQTLNDFNEKKIDILIGTQMIAKGHDYHNVELSIILGMDYMLHIPDYRCCENSFSLLYQVAGRSGRKEDGKIIIQTKESQQIQALLGDYKKVLKHELDSRIDLYPPFCRLALISFSHKDESQAKNIAIEFSHFLQTLQNKQIPTLTIPPTLLPLLDDFEIVGISEGTILKIKNVFYYQVLLRSCKKFVLQKILSFVIPYLPHHITQHIDIDIDPLSI